MSDCRDCGADALECQRYHRETGKWCCPGCRVSGPVVMHTGDTQREWLEGDES